jgi:hypothetical protein
VKDQKAGGKATEESLHSVYFIDANNGWAVGDNGTILHWDGASSKWEVKDQKAGGKATAKSLQALSLIAANSGWAVGEKGTILYLDPNTKLWQIEPCITDKTADELMLTASDATENVKSYSLGLGKKNEYQTEIIPGQDGSTPGPSAYKGSEEKKTGIYALKDVDLFNILCLPDVTDFDKDKALDVLTKAIEFCREKRAFLIIDCPGEWDTFEKAADKLSLFDSIRDENAAMYFPRVMMPDPLDDSRLRSFPPCGIMAGIYARTDGTRGVWKAPAGQETKLLGVNSLTYRLTDQENGVLNPLGLNCLRTFPIIGPISWGARTLKGADVLASEWKYIPVRRFALYIEESLYRGLKWVVFEPNDEPLWSQIRLNVGAFMHNLFRQGAFQGSKPKDAYFVRCDADTTTQNDIDQGVVNILVGFAPLKPAEFVIIKIQQMAGQIQT